MESRPRREPERVTQRHQKAGRWADALWWAERGLSLYGESAARAEAVTDLRDRADGFRRKLEPTAAPPARRSAAHAVWSSTEDLPCAVCGSVLRGRARANGSRRHVQRAYGTASAEAEPRSSCVCGESSPGHYPSCRCKPRLRHAVGQRRQRGATMIMSRAMWSIGRNGESSWRHPRISSPGTGRRSCATGTPARSTPSRSLAKAYRAAEIGQLPTWPTGTLTCRRAWGTSR